VIAMQRLWSAEELGERWTLGAEDLALLTGLPDAGKLGLAAQLAYWRQNSGFPDEEADLAPAVIGHLADHVGVHADVLEGYEWTGRTGRRHRRLVLDHLAVATFDEAAETKFGRKRHALVDAGERARAPTAARGLGQKLEGLDFNSIKGITLDLCKRIDTDSCPKDPATTRKPNSTVEQLRQSYWGSGSQVFGSVRPLRAVTLRL
jgi:hypothetical protein